MIASVSGTDVLGWNKYENIIFVSNLIGNLMKLMLASMQQQISGFYIQKKEFCNIH